MLVSMSPLTFGLEVLLDTESVSSPGCSEINDADKVQSRLKGVSLSYDTDSSKKQSLSTTGLATVTDSCNKIQIMEFHIHIFSCMHLHTNIIFTSLSIAS